MPSCTVFFSFESVDQTSCWQYKSYLDVAVLFPLDFDAHDSDDGSSSSHSLVDKLHCSRDSFIHTGVSG